MVNVFLKLTIAIPFLIISLMRASSHSCVYNRSAMVKHYENVVQKDITRVKSSLNTSFSTCCKTGKDPSITFPDVCNNSTKVDNTRKNFEEHCCSSSKNLTFCCQFKNLYYLGCLLNHYSKNLRRNTNSSAITALTRQVTSLVKQSNNYLCINATNKSPKRSKHGQQLDNEIAGSQDNCRRICKLNETIHSYEIRWQEFLASNDCS
ncbi:uncharacterized protein [Eleutherodactylus coqui]|uniref:uncharacterized protein n=1 Tax=Eleutherodactylus coqui TaxID=57060 RepID=UPI0034626C2E